MIGTGPAGLAAAVAAAEQGVPVVLLEKSQEVGGTARFAIGSVSASGTSLQQAAGVEDSWELHERDLAVLAGPDADRDNLTFRRILARESGPTLEWLRSHGVDFFGPIQEDPHSRPRMHVAIPGAGAYVSRLHRAARRLGVRTVRGVEVLDVVTDASGRVIGVMVRRGTRRSFLRASVGVVLATGDFSASDLLKSRYLGAAAASSPAINPDSTGDGHLLALSHGATVVNGDLAMSPQLRFAPPARAEILRRLPAWRPMTRVLRRVLPRLPRDVLAWLYSYYLTSYMAPSPKLLVAGARLVDDTGRLLSSDPDAAIEELSEANRAGYLVMSETIARRFEAWPNYVSTSPGIAYAYMDDYRRLRPDLVHSGDTLSGVTRGAGVTMGAPALGELEQWFETGAPRSSEGGPEPRRERTSRRWRPARRSEEERYLALGPVRGWSVLTDGGLRVSDSHLVLGGDGEPIAGLYAAGATGQGGAILNGHGHHLMWALVSGRRVGASVAHPLAPDPSRESAGDRSTGPPQGG